MLGSKPGSFDQHPALEKLIEDLKNWKYEELNTEENINETLKIFTEIFDQFDNVKVDVSKFGYGEN